MIRLPEVRLGDVVQPVSNWNPQHSGNGSCFQYIDLSSVDQDTKAITASRTINCADAPSRARKLVAAGDVLVSTVRPNLNGVAAVPPEMDGATASTGFCVLRPNPARMDGRYLFHWVRSPQFVDAMVRRATGASYPAITDRIVLSSSIYLPPLAEQRRIADLLDRADVLRTKRLATIAQLETLIQAIFLDMFGDPETNPRGWPREQLGGFTDRITKGESPAWQGYRYQDSGALFVTSENVRLGQIDLTNPKFVSIDFHHKLSRSKLRDGDLLVNLVGASIGRSCLFTGWSGPANINQAVAVITLRPEFLDPVFLVNLLTVNGGQRLILNNRVEAARANISLSDLRKLPIPIPPIALQRKFVTSASHAANVRNGLRSFLAQQDGLLASLQYRAFRGEL
jgi:type I restriction enzyme, S subunit